jgi:glycerol dehydrogenase
MGAPLKYVQGPGELKNLPAHLSPLGTSLLAVIDPFLYDSLSKELLDICSKDSFKIKTCKFGGECTLGEVARVSALAEAEKASVVAGLGGGKTLDAAKLAARNLGLPVAVIPTSASTDAPVSAMAILYHPDGRHIRAELLGRAPDLVLVDTEIIAKAPLRLFAAGIGDALSTWYEAEANRLSQTPNYIGQGYQSCLAAQAVARACFEAVKGRGREALEDLAAGKLSAAVEDVIEANILLSGLGFENTGCAAAHALHTGLHEISGSNAIYHGEMVALGVLFQLVLEEAPEKELIEEADFLAGLGLPVSFEDMGLSVGEAELDKIVARILSGSSGIEAEPFELTPEKVKRALRGADALGRSRRSQRPELRKAFCSPAVRAG